MATDTAIHRLAFIARSSPTAVHSAHDYAPVEPLASAGALTYSLGSRFCAEGRTWTGDTRFFRPGPRPVSCRPAMVRSARDPRAPRGRAPRRRRAHARVRLDDRPPGRARARVSAPALANGSTGA